jgi:hypothetical protein
MQNSKISFFIFLLCSLAWTSFTLAQESAHYRIDNPNVNSYPQDPQFSGHGQGTGPCGCSCSPDCSCGCAETGVCHCHEGEYDENNYSEERDGLCCEHYGAPEYDCANCCLDLTQDPLYYAKYAGTSWAPLYPWGPLDTCNNECYRAQCCGLHGVWFPEEPTLFRPFVADPRQVTYSVGWRFNDKVVRRRNIIDVSYGDTCAIYRWCDICGGQLQFEVEGALWAIFDPLHDSSPLIDADYYVGFPLTFARGPWTFRLRAYHISTHIGDEFLLEHLGFNINENTAKQTPAPHKRFDRRNPSVENLDFFISYELTNQIRVYDGIGVVLAQDKSFRRHRWYLEGGLELRIPQLGFSDICNQIYGEPFYGMHYRWQGDFKRHTDMTYVLGYEIGKLSGLRRKLRAFVEYHDGYEIEGQFSRFATHYLSFRISYGF